MPAKGKTQDHRSQGSLHEQTPLSELLRRDGRCPPTRPELAERARRRRFMRIPCCALRPGRQRKREVECGSGAKLAFGPDPAAVRLHDVLDNGQSQPGSPRLARPGLVDAIEALKDPLQMFG